MKTLNLNSEELLLASSMLKVLGHPIRISIIELLDDENREDFRKWVNTAGSFNANNVFICKSHSLYNDYCKSLFNWLERCEEIFGFDPKRSYSRIRVYAFLAERYLSYWFKKNSNYILWPMKFHDITNDKINF